VDEVEGGIRIVKSFLLGWMSLGTYLGRFGAFSRDLSEILG
jgi:hypothetical protein